jgi:translation initiation factor IF-2
MTTHTQKNISRPPVVVIMGHIDHGKSTLLDYIRKTNTTAKEAGGITQHLGAYEVVHTTSAGKESRITFLDTPGHEAFEGIRTRGVTVADIAVLVVSAEDGVKPQTLEALKSILGAKIPYVVAINKIDKPNASVERTKQSLAENEIYIEGYGGTTPSVPISALSGEGVSDLLDMILLVAELEDLKGDADKPAEGVVIEADLDSKTGVSATLIIKEGTLKAGMTIAAGDAVSPVRILHDYQGKKIEEAGLSKPVKVIGFSKVPSVGVWFKSFDSKKDAEKYALEHREKDSAKIENVKEETAENTVVIPVIIKADVTGSLEGIRHELKKMKHERVIIKVVSEAIGSISENDIKLASGTKDALIIGFNTSVDAKARSLAERSGTEIKLFDIIYKVVEYLDEVAKVRTPKIFGEQITGKAKIIRIFSKNKDKQVLGGKVQLGELRVGEEIRILRRDAEIGKGRIRELQSQKVKVSEIKEGFEFGTMVESKIEIAEGDKIEGFTIVEQ